MLTNNPHDKKLGFGRALAAGAVTTWFAGQVFGPLWFTGFQSLVCASGSSEGLGGIRDWTLAAHGWQCAGATAEEGSGSFSEFAPTVDADLFVDLGRCSWKVPDGS